MSKSNTQTLITKKYRTVFLETNGIPGLLKEVTQNVKIENVNMDTR